MNSLLGKTSKFWYTNSRPTHRLIFLFCVRIRLPYETEERDKRQEGDSHWRGVPSVSRAAVDCGQKQSLPHWCRPNPPDLREEEELQRYWAHSYTHTHTIWIKAACFTFPALQRNQVTLEVERLYKHLHEVELSLNAWTNKILSFKMLLKECSSNGNEMYGVSLTHLDSAEFVLLSGVIVNHHHKVITDVAFLIAAALVALAVRHQSGYMEDGCRETKHLH